MTHVSITTPIPASPNHMPRGVQVVLTENDVVHIAHETGKHDQSDVYNNEACESDHYQKMNGTGRLPTSEHLRKPGCTINQRR